MGFTDFLYLLCGGIIFAAIQLGIGFFREKGKNYATKQDIVEITHSIENVKKDYRVQIEELKAGFQMNIGNKAVIREKTNEALLQFFEDSMILLHEKLTSNPLDHFDIKETVEYQKSTLHLFTEIYLEYYRLLLYFSGNEDIINSARNILLATIEIRKFFKERFVDVKTSLINEDFEVKENKMKNYKETVLKTDKILSNYHKDLSPLHEKLNDAFEEYRINLNIYFQEMGINIGLE